MTEAGKRVQKKSVGRAAFCLMTLFLLVLLLKNSAIASKAITAGLRLCVGTLIPSLFPLMVASELLVESGIVGRVGRLLHRPFRAIFGLRGDAACAVLLGFICGFPVGTKCAVSLYRRGALGEKEFCRVLAFSNQPSSAFLVYTVGGAMFGNLRFGLCLYLSTLLSATAVQLVLRERKKDTSQKSVYDQAPTTLPSFPDALAKAVSGSALSLLSICAFVVFFSAIVESLAYLATGISLSSTATALLFSLFELTGGVSHAALCAPKIAPILCALAVAWGGLSVHFQLLHLTGDAPFSLASYFFTKLAQGVLNIPIFLLLWGWVG